jgi:hypothetical protein
MPCAKRLLLNCNLILLVCAVMNAQQMPTSTTAVVPRLVNFSGKATDAEGKPVTGIAGITFAIYKDQSGGAPLWLESQNVNADPKGNYTVQLGATSAEGLPLDLFTSGEARWLGVRVNGGDEQPRVLLLSVPYALKAADAETVGGLPASAFMLAAAASAASATAESSVSGSGAGPLPAALAGGGTLDFIPLWTPNGSTLGNSVLFQSGSGATAKVGINTTSPAATLDVNGAETVRGNLSLPATGTAAVTGGKNSQPLTLSASVFNSTTGTAATQNFRWQAEPVGNDTANTTATLNLLYGAGGNPISETGLKVASNGRITFAAGQTFPGTIDAVKAGTDLSSTTSNGTATISLNTTSTDARYAQLAAANTFTANQTIKGSLSASGVLNAGTVNAASAFTLGGSTFAFSPNGNVFLGFAGNPSITGSANTGIGSGALAGNTAGGGNTATGEAALFHTTGSNNTATGAGALASNGAGVNNTAAGYQSLLNSTGSNNTVVGYQALYNNTTGGNNTALGYLSGTSSTGNNLIGSNNTFLGAGTGHVPNNISNATAIGANAEVDESNALVLGSINFVNGATADTNVGIGTTTPVERLDLGNNGNVVIRADPGNDSTAGSVAYELIGRGAGGVPNKWSIYTAPVGGGGGIPVNSLSIWQYPPNSTPACCLQRFVIMPALASSDTGSTVVIDQNGNMSVGDLTAAGCVQVPAGILGGSCLSDIRLKKNIQPYAAVLNKLVQLQPVTYNWRAEEYPQFHLGAARTSGLIAQRVEEVFPEMVALDKNA